VRSWVGTQKWELPGGVRKKGEDSKAVARRELQEETGIDVSYEGVEYVTTLRADYEAPIYTVSIMSSQLPTRPYNRWEIEALEWFLPSELPVGTSLLVHEALQKLPKRH
jgi:8-oxo-dGTP pyrophosphatase MutT (NUDIX family)